MRFVYDNFDVLFDTPGSIDTFKKLILEMAVRGKLVPQDPNSEPASALIERIDLERERLIREKRIRKPKGLPPIRENEVPFELPESWEWVRLGKAVTIRGGSGFPKALQGELSGEYPFFKVSDLSNSVTTEVMGAENWLNRAIVKEKGYKTFPRGTIVFPKIGGALLTNNRKILGIEGLIDNNCMGVIPFLKDCRDFVFLFFFTLDMGEFASGTSVPAVSQARVSSILFPLPPIEEQKRIVAKVDELMKWCDELEAKIEGVEKRGETLTVAVLNSF